MDCRLLCASPEMMSVERQLRSLIKEHHRLYESAEQLGSPAAAKVRTAMRLQQEIINKAYQLKHVSSAYRDSLKVPSHLNGEIPLPKSLAQKLFAQSAISKESKDDRQMVTSHRVIVEKKKNPLEEDTQKVNSQIKVEAHLNGSQSDSIATPMAPTISAANAVAAVTTVSSAASIRQESATKSVALPVLSSNVLVHQQSITSNGNASAPAAGLKLSSASKPALFIIKVPPSQTGQFNIVTVQPHLNPVNGLNGITGVVNGIGAPLNGAVVVNNLNGLPFNNLTTLTSLNTTLTTTINNSTTINNNNNNNNNNNSNNNNNNMQIGNCKFLPVPTAVAVQKVSMEAASKVSEDEPENGRESRSSSQCEGSVSRSSASDESSPTRAAGILFEKVARTHEQQTWFLANLGLCSRDKHRQLLERRKERRRRKTANPQFCAAAMEERRRLESLRRKKKLVIPDGKSKLKFKEELEQRAEKLKTEREELLRKHEQAQQRLLEERARTQILTDEHRAMEETLERLRSFVTLLAEERQTVKWT